MMDNIMASNRKMKAIRIREVIASSLSERMLSNDANKRKKVPFGYTPPIV